MLSKSPLAATLPFRGLEAAREFYADQLGLELLAGSVEDGFLEFKCGGATKLQLFESDSDQKSDNTAATFEVDDLDQEMKALRKKGVEFEEYDLPNIKTKNGVAEADGMGRMAWIKDPDGNVLALHEGA